MKTVLLYTYAFREEEKIGVNSSNAKIANTVAAQLWCGRVFFRINDFEFRSTPLGRASVVDK